ncbi:MAG TPA: hypothetical protein VFH70_05930, partial [Acidimicrobiales bacterium]|nr:hypothetical protein [Acidimicrobiales bacterium]
MPSIGERLRNLADDAVGDVRLPGLPSRPPRRTMPAVVGGLVLAVVFAALAVGLTRAGTGGTELHTTGSGPGVSS